MALWVPEFLQTKRYSAQRLRAALQDMPLQEGVNNFSASATSMQVKQKQSGANMSVDIFGGSGWITGDSVVRQGLYHVVNDASFNLSVGNNSSGNPRIDQVICRINDSTHGGSGDTATFEVLAGTPTAGATLDNRNGAAALPASAMRLADILVANGAASILDANIRDRRQWAKGAYTRIVRTSNAGGTDDYSTNSVGAYVAVDDTNLRARIEVSGLASVRMMLTGVWLHQTTGGSVAIQARMDGAQIGHEYLSIANSTNSLTSFTHVVDALPSGGSHLFSWGFYTTSGGNGILRATPTYPLTMVVQEFLSPTGHNGTS